MLGSQTVTLRTYTNGARDRLNNPIRVPVDTVLTGVSMQPMSVTEQVALTDVETEMWKCFLPPTPAALAVDTTAEIIYQQQTYQVLGAKPGIGFTAMPDHVLLELKKQTA